MNHDPKNKECKKDECILTEKNHPLKDCVYAPCTCSNTDKGCCKKCSALQIGNLHHCVDNYTCECHLKAKEGRKCYECGNSVGSCPKSVSGAHRFEEVYITPSLKSSICKYCNREHDTDMACREYYNHVNTPPFTEVDWKNELSLLILQLSKKKDDWNSAVRMNDFMEEFVEKQIASTRAEGAKEYRQFILNILDGVDEADRQAGNKGGGTLAIRHAIKSRLIEPDINNK